MSDRNGRLANLLCALSLAITDAADGSARQAAGTAGSGAAALVTVMTRPGLSIESLRKILGISQPATVRLVDRLASDGLVARTRGPDERTLAIRPTVAGRRAARTILRARRRAVSPLLEALREPERTELTGLLEKLLAGLPDTREQARHLCRLCDQPLCEDPACPVDQAAPPARP